MKRIAVLLAVALLFVIAFQVEFLGLNDFQDPFLHAARDGDIAVIAKLLANGSSPNRSDGYGNTPLTIAAHFGRTHAAEFLINNGAIVDGIGDGKMTPLHCAVYGRHHETAAVFVKNHADPNTADEYGITPLASAARNGDVGLVELLLKAGADTELDDDLGWRPLHVTLRATGLSESDRLATVGTLLQYGADPNANNVGGYEKDGEHDSHVGFRIATLPNQGNTPLTIAENNGFVEIVELLKKHGGS